MGKVLVISGADFSANAIPVAKAVDGTTSPQYVYAANVNNPGSGFDWDAHKVAISVNSDGTITNFNLPDDTTYIPYFTAGGLQNTNDWLKEIDISCLSNFQLKTFKDMLKRNIALKKVIFGGKFPNVTGSDAIREMFYGCTSLEEVIIDDSFDTPNLNDAGFLFYTTGVKSVKGLDNLIKPTVTNLAYLFCNSSRIEEIDFTNCNTTNVTSFQNLVSGCTALEQIKGLNDLNTANVTSFTNAFNSTKIKNLDISSWNIQSNAQTQQMFDASYITELNANCFTALYGNVKGMFYLNNWKTIHLDNLNDVSAVTTSDRFFSRYVSGTPKVTIANVTNEAVKTFLKSKLNAVSAGGSSDWQEATVDGVLCLVPNV